MLFLIIMPRISAQRVYRKIDTGSPWRQQQPILKKDDKLPFWLTLSFTLLLNNFIQGMIELPKPKNSITLYINGQNTESKAFLKSTESSNPGILFSSVYCIMSLINLVFSPIYLPTINPVWSLCISLCRVPLILAVMTPGAILYTQLSNDIGLKF